ncbi:MAG: DUF4037 domain-containing protein [Armatimonadota bacterium]|nr:MAG: DUF4037 domain-containing protein [Armatimonadota bacterium]
MGYEFVKGMVLAERLYHEGVKPAMAQHFPELRYSAARLRGGSDVLGYDTPISMDHGWGPVVEVYLSAADYMKYANEIVEVMRHNLPREIAGVPTNFDSTSHQEAKPKRLERGPVEHRVACHNIDTFVISYRSFNPNDGMTVLDWLTIPQQNLRLIRSGRVFHDGLEELKPIREKLHYYPDEVWYYLLSAQWEHIGQESPFMGRCGDVGDELGSRVLAARLIHYMMDLCFLMERQYAPYSKWFGTAFCELRCAAHLKPILQSALDARTWQEREKHMSQAYGHLAEMHNTLGITGPLPTNVGRFYTRPYLVPEGDFAGAICEKITSEEIKRLPSYVGSVDLLTNLVCVRDWPDRRARLVGMYAAAE